MFVLDTGSNMTSKYGTGKLSLLLYAITNAKTVKLMQNNRMQAASKTFPAETHSNNSGRYTLLKSHIPWSIVSKEAHSANDLQEK